MSTAGTAGTGDRARPGPDQPAPLPADGHVHSEWSWDAPYGSMERTCARALELGLPAVAFTEHADHTVWAALTGDLHEGDHLLRFLTPDGSIVPPPLDATGYLECVQRCRDLFPGLRIITGVELGEPHRHHEAATALLQAGRFDRVLGSVHTLPIGERFAEPPYLFAHRRPDDVVRDYLAEIPRLVSGSDAFTVLAHLDYPLRYWPDDAGPLDPGVFQDEFRHALRALADSGRVLEVNTAGPMLSELVDWWRDEGGHQVSFGSDAHNPEDLARGFADAAAMVQAHGFRPGRHPYDVWTRPA